MKSTMNAKVVLLGSSFTGKTSLLVRGVRGSFSDNQAATIGAAFMKYNISVEGKIVTLEIWDTAGQERYNALSSMYYRGAEAALVVYDVTSMESFESARRWANQVRVDVPEIVVFIIGNKTDLRHERMVDLAVAEEFVNKERAKDTDQECPSVYLMESSAKLDINVKEIFQQLGEVLLKKKSRGSFAKQGQRLDSIQFDKAPEPASSACYC